MDGTLLERIKELCSEKGISQRQLQRDLGLSVSTVSSWKKAVPSVTTLQRVAEYFNVTVEYLTGKTKYRNKEHMLQSFDENFKPDLTNTDIPYDYCVKTSEGIIFIESKAAAPRFIDPATRQIAEKIMDNEELKTVMTYLEKLSPDQFTTVYNMILMLDHK